MGTREEIKQIKEMRAKRVCVLWEAGETQGDIAVLVGCSVEAVSEAVNRFFEPEYYGVLYHPVGGGSLARLKYRMTRKRSHKAETIFAIVDVEEAEGKAIYDLCCTLDEMRSKSGAVSVTANREYGV